MSDFICRQNIHMFLNECFAVLHINKSRQCLKSQLLPGPLSRIKKPVIRFWINYTPKASKASIIECSHLAMINKAVNASLHSIMRPAVQHELTEYQITAAIIIIFYSFNCAAQIYMKTWIIYYVSSSLGPHVLSSFSKTWQRFKCTCWHDGTLEESWEPVTFPVSEVTGVMFACLRAL